jgi:hypothetical protein
MKWNSSVHAVLNTLCKRKRAFLFSGVSDIFIQTLICWCLGIISSKCSASKLYSKYHIWLV